LLHHRLFARFPAARIQDAPPRCSRRLLLRGGQQRLRRHARLCFPGPAPGPVGDHRLHPRPATEPACPARRPSRKGTAGGPKSPGGKTMSTVSSSVTSQEWDRVQRKALIAGAAGLVLCVAGVLLSPEDFFRSYLVAFNFWLGISLGCL